MDGLGNLEGYRHQTPGSWQQHWRVTLKDNPIQGTLLDDSRQGIMTESLGPNSYIQLRICRPSLVNAQGATETVDIYPVSPGEDTSGKAVQILVVYKSILSDLDQALQYLGL